MRIGIDVGGTNTDAVLMDGLDDARMAQDADNALTSVPASSACCAICWAKPKLPLPTSGP